MAGIAKSAIAKIEAYIEKKGSKVKSNPSDISTALTEKKEKKVTPAVKLSIQK